MSFDSPRHHRINSSEILLMMLYNNGHSSHFFESSSLNPCSQWTRTCWVLLWAITGNSVKNVGQNRYRWGCWHFNVQNYKLTDTDQTKDKKYNCRKCITKYYSKIGNITNILYCINKTSVYIKICVK